MTDQSSTPDTGSHALAGWTANRLMPDRNVLEDIEFLTKQRNNAEIQRLLDRIAKEDDDARILGYARQVRALIRGEIFDGAQQ
jgi:hypothetical protein